MNALSKSLFCREIIYKFAIVTGNFEDCSATSSGVIDKSKVLPCNSSNSVIMLE